MVAAVILVGEGVGSGVGRIASTFAGVLLLVAFRDVWLEVVNRREAMMRLSITRAALPLRVPASNGTFSVHPPPWRLSTENQAGHVHSSTGIDWFTTEGREAVYAFLPFRA